MGKRFSVEVLLDLVDKFSGPLKSGPMKQLTELQKQVDITDRSMSRMFAGGGLIAAGAAIAAPLIIGVQKASSLNEALNKNQVVLGQHARAVSRWAQTSATAFGLSELKAVDAVGTFGSLFRAMDVGQVPAAKMSMNLTKLAGDLSSFYDKDPTQALEALRSGLIGESEPLRAFGVNLSAALIAKKALDAGLINTPTPYEKIPQATRALATYQLILQKTALAQGDYARTADSTSNATRTISQIFENIMTNLGGIESMLNPFIVGFRNFLGVIERLTRANPLLTRALAVTTLGLAALLTLIGLGIVTVAGLNLAMAQARIGLMLYAGTSETAAGSQGLFNLALAGTRLRFTQAATGAKAFYASMLGAARLKLAALQAGGLSGALAVLRVGFMNAARASWAFTASLLTNPVFLMIAALVALGAGFIYAWRKSEDFRTGVMRGLEPIRRSWAGLKDDVAALGQTFAPLGATFSRITSAMGLDLSKIKRPLDALGYAFGYFIGFVGTAMAITFGRTISFLVTGFGGLVQTVNGLITAGQGLVSLDFAKMTAGLSQARGGLEQTLLAPLELAGVDTRQYRADLGVANRDGKTIWGRIGGWLGIPGVAAAPDAVPFAFGLNTMNQKAEDWGVATRGFISEKFQTAGARTGALLGSLGEARPKIKTWRDDATSWLGTQFTTVAANVAPFLNSVSAASDESRPVWQSLLDKVTAPFDLPRANRRNFTPSLENAATKGTELWATVRAQFPAFALPGLDRATNFASSLTSGETEGGDAWGRIQALFQSFALPGLNRRSSFVPSLAGAEAAGSDAWDNIKKLFPTFRLPWLKHDKFKESLNKAKGESKPIWEGITAFLIRPFSLPWAKHDKFKESLGKAEEKGKPIWGRVTSLLKAAIPIPGVDWSAIEGSLGDVLKIIQDFGPQMLEAGASLIGSLIDGFNSRIKELTDFLDKLKFPWQKDKRSTQTNPAERAVPVPAAAATYTPAVVNRTATPTAMRPVVPQQAVPFDLEATLKFGNVNPYSDYGKLLAQGFAKGILSEQQVAVYAVQRMGAATEAALKQQLQIRSPSRVFAGLGAFIPQGLGRGIVGQKGAVTKAMQTLAAAAVAVPITPALAMPEAPSFALGAPPALTRPAVTNPSEPGGRTTQGAAAGQTVHKTYSFAGANFNLDMSEINSKDDFTGKLEQLFEWFGDDE